jgi:S1-C subfamily serine protease
MYNTSSSTEVNQRANLQSAGRHLHVSSGFAQTTLDGVGIAKKTGPAVVMINGQEASGRVSGSGFLVSSDGKIATSLHVVQNLRSGIVQLANGERFNSFSVRAFDETRDLAIIQISGFDMPKVLLGNSNDIQPGEPVLLIGNPNGLQGTVTTGVISGVRELPEGIKIIQTDAAANPGNSGGPLLNARGEVIGVLGFKLKGSENLNFALPINYVRGLLNTLQSPMSLDDLRSRLGKSVAEAEALTSKSVGIYPTKWKSLTSGNQRLLRFNGDFIYGEREVTGEDKAGGMIFGVYELKKEAEKFLGIYRFVTNCTYRDLWTSTTGWRSNRCTLETKMELHSITADRIEGRGQGPDPKGKFDCKKCSYDRPLIWENFVWIPQL